MRGRIIPGRTAGERPQSPRTGSSAGAWCETWLCSGGQSTAVNSAKGCPVNDLQSAARFGGTAPSCALLVAGAASGEPREVRMIGIARGEIEQSSHGQGRRRTGGRRVVRLFGYALLQRSRWSQSPGLGPRAPVRVRPLSRSRLASADLFGKGDDDARGAAEVTEQEDALVLRHLAEEFGAVGAQAGDGVMDVVDSEHDAMQAQRVGRRVLRLGADRRGGVVLRQLQLAVAVRGPHHRDVAPDAVESDGAVRPKTFDLPLAFQLHAELGEERDSRVQVVDDDCDVVHPLNSHIPEYKQRRAAGRAEEGCVCWPDHPRPGAAGDRPDLDDRAAQAGGYVPGPNHRATRTT